MSTINMLLQDHAKPPVALGPLVSGVRKGLANCQLDTTPQVKRLLLPEPVMLIILELSELLLPIVHWDVHDPNLLLLRAAATSMVSYIFFNRGECSACALSSASWSTKRTSPFF